MTAPAHKPPPARLASVDAYRGFVMFLMMAEVLHLAALAEAYPDSAVWPLLARHQEHVEWVGCTLHDLIQPSFSFLVGVALPFSIASRMAKGQSTLRMTVHAFWRALVLAALGIFLRSVGKDETNYTFDDTLTQIGLGYGFLFLLGFRPARDHWIAVAVILIGYWAAFAMYTPGPGLESIRVGVPDDWPHHVRGFAAHWDKNANLAWAVDTRFLNLFPRPTPFRFHPGGYATLSFVPTLATMILGLIAGNVLRGDRPGTGWGKVAWFVVAGAVFLAAGYALGAVGVCPVVKRIWTPSWVLFSGGWCFLLLAGWYAAVDLLGLGALAFPLAVIGRNSIAAYCMSGLLKGFIAQTFATHLGPHAFAAFGPAYESTLRGAAVLLVLWLVLFWMDRRKLYLRV